jgi:hypothetical protein
MKMPSESYLPLLLNSVHSPHWFVGLVGELWLLAVWPSQSQRTGLGLAA